MCVCVCVVSDDEDDDDTATADTDYDYRLKAIGELPSALLQRSSPSPDQHHQYRTLPNRRPSKGANINRAVCPCVCERLNLNYISHYTHAYAHAHTYTHLHPARTRASNSLSFVERTLARWHRSRP